MGKRLDGRALPFDSRRDDQIGGLVALAVISLLACAEQVVVRETRAGCGNGAIEAGETCDVNCACNN